MTMIVDNREPVLKEHFTFGQAVVALARKHGFNHIRVQFYGHDKAGHDIVTMDWSAGRHGTKKHMTFKAEATYRVEETIPCM